jgi:hypothetical protein
MEMLLASRVVMKRIRLSEHQSEVEGRKKESAAKKAVEVIGRFPPNAAASGGSDSIWICVARFFARSLLRNLPLSAFTAKQAINMSTSGGTNHYSRFGNRVA